MYDEEPLYSRQSIRRWGPLADAVPSPIHLREIHGKPRPNNEQTKVIFVCAKLKN